MYKQTANPSALKTQELFCNALLAALKHASLSSVKISDLCASTGISRNGFYRNFESVEDVLIFHLDSICIEMIRELSGIPKSSDYLKEYMSRFFYFWYHHRDTLDLFFRNNVSHLLITRLAELVEFTMEEKPGSRTKKLGNPIEGYVFLSSGMIGILYSWIRNDYDIVPEQMAEWITKNLRSAFGMDTT